MEAVGLHASNLVNLVDARFSLGWSDQQLSELSDLITELHGLMDESRFSRFDVAKVIATYIDAYCHLDTDEAQEEELLVMVLDCVDV